MANLMFLRALGVEEEALDLVVEMVLAQNVDEEMTTAINYLASGFLLALLTLREEGAGGIRPLQELPCHSMTETLHLTIVYEDGGDGWIVASIPEVPGALSQGHTRQEARENVIDALRGVLQLRFGEHALSEPASDSEPLELTIAA